MNRPTLNWLVDLLAFAAFVLLTTSGALTRFVLPPGSGRFTTLWGLDRHGWGDLHFWIAVALLTVLALHLVLHWRWILCMIRGQHSEASGVRVGLGLVGLIGLLGIAVAPFFAEVERTGEPPQRARNWQPPAIQSSKGQRHAPATDAGQSAPQAQQWATPGVPAAQLPQPQGQPRSAVTEEETGVEAIRGSMTLREVSQLTGVPLDYLISGLGLSHSVDPDERIGRLRKQYNMGPDDVRRVVKEYRPVR